MLHFFKNLKAFCQLLYVLDITVSAQRISIQHPYISLDIEEGGDVRVGVANAYRMSAEVFYFDCDHGESKLEYADSTTLKRRVDEISERERGCAQQI